jgi:hypothetical protein
VKKKREKLDLILKIHKISNKERIKRKGRDTRRKSSRDRRIRHTSPGKLM